jgi:hypothetical protein
MSFRKAATSAASLRTTRVSFLAWLSFMAAEHTTVG